MCDSFVLAPQDIEFTVQQGKLYMLQTRSGKRVGQAAVKIAVDLVQDGLATVDQAIMTVKPEHLNQLLHPQFVDTASETYKEAVVTLGLPASPGAAVGRVVFTPEAAEAMHAKGEKCILVREDTSPEGVHDYVLTVRQLLTYTTPSNLHYTSPSRICPLSYTHCLLHFPCLWPHNLFFVYHFNCQYKLLDVDGM